MVEPRKWRRGEARNPLNSARAACKVAEAALLSGDREALLKAAYDLTVAGGTLTGMVLCGIEGVRESGE